MSLYQITRRKFFAKSIGVAGAVLTTQALADVCSPVTGGQPLGPFFPNLGTPIDPIKENKDPNIPLYLSNDNDLTYVQGRSGKAKGQVVYITGTVQDDHCSPIPNATIIIWQASATGRYNHKGDSENHDFRHPLTGEIVKRLHDPSFQYWGRAQTNERGEYLFKTIVPGFYPADLSSGWYRPPHIHFLVSAVGFPQLVTQMYFNGRGIENNEWIQKLNEKDFLLQSNSLSAEQKERLLVEFKPSTRAQIRDGLIGKFDISLSRS